MLQKKGFTLVEIMVVVAIVTIVLAIVVPAITEMKKKANIEVCTANLKTISIAKKIWYIDYADESPQWTDLVPDYIRRQPACPMAGTYTIGVLDANPTCTVEGHELK